MFLFVPVHVSIGFMNLRVINRKTCMWTKKVLRSKVHKTCDIFDGSLEATQNKLPVCNHVVDTPPTTFWHQKVP